MSPAKDGEGDPYYHGDIKDQNFVVSGSTLKLIDYGTLSKVCRALCFFIVADRWTVAMPRFYVQVFRSPEQPACVCMEFPGPLPVGQRQRGPRAAHDADPRPDVPQHV